MDKTEHKELELLNKEIIKNKILLDNEKELFINQIKKLSKNDILVEKRKVSEKLSLWAKMKKVLMGL